MATRWHGRSARKCQGEVSPGEAPGAAAAAAAAGGTRRTRHRDRERRRHRGQGGSAGSRTCQPCPQLRYRPSRQPGGEGGTAPRVAPGTRSGLGVRGWHRAGTERRCPQARPGVAASGLREPSHRPGPSRSIPVHPGSLQAPPGRPRCSGGSGGSSGALSAAGTCRGDPHPNLGSGTFPSVPAMGGFGVIPSHSSACQRIDPSGAVSPFRGDIPGVPAVPTLSSARPVPGDTPGCVTVSLQGRPPQPGPVSANRGRAGAAPSTGAATPTERSWPVPSWRPRRLNRGRAGHRALPVPRCVLPRAPTRLFCKSPEIFMALRRAPLNEFLIKTPSRSPNPPPAPLNPRPRGRGAAGPPVPGSGRSRARPERLLPGEAPGQTEGGDGTAAPGAGTARLPQDLGCPTPRPGLPPLPGPAGSDRAAGKPRLDGTGRGRASRCPQARPRGIFVNEEMQKRSSLGESAEPGAIPEHRARAGRAREGTGAAPAAAAARSRFGGRGSRWLRGLKPGLDLGQNGCLGGIRPPSLPPLPAAPLAAGPALPGALGGFGRRADVPRLTPRNGNVIAGAPLPAARPGWPRAPRPARCRCRCRFPPAPVSRRCRLPPPLRSRQPRCECRAGGEVARGGGPGDEAWKAALPPAPAAPGTMATGSVGTMPGGAELLGLQDTSSTASATPGPGPPLPGPRTPRSPGTVGKRVAALGGDTREGTPNSAQSVPAPLRGPRGALPAAVTQRGSSRGPGRCRGRAQQPPCPNAGMCEANRARLFRAWERAEGARGPPPAAPRPAPAQTRL
ncbi:basic proline-rich protein-like [Ammospiza caudacuta]|uniref:basic proline-rich protein-like n=1 Tax=Ammospiza caudacuta TaxID=2857398 RepID=UPI00273842F0|nr:basic proline-rich protein-like [Ammospiza caudacuta]